MSEQSIYDKSLVIRNETQQYANTRGRVADVLDDINATKANKKDVDAAIQVILDELGITEEYRIIKPSKNVELYQDFMMMKYGKKQKPNKNGIKCRLVDMNNNVEYSFGSLTEMSRWLGYARWPHSTEYGIVHKKGESSKKYRLYEEN